MLKFSNRPPSASPPVIHAGVCQHMHNADTTVYTLCSSTCQSCCGMPALRSVQGRMDGFEPQKYGCKMLHTSSYYFLDWCNYSRVIIAYNYFYSQNLGASCKAALHSTRTQSRSTGTLLVNESIYFYRWALRYCTTNKTKNDELNDPHVCLFVFYFTWVKFKHSIVGLPSLYVHFCSRWTHFLSEVITDTTPAFLCAGQFCSSLTPF